MSMRDGYELEDLSSLSISVIIPIDSMLAIISGTFLDPGTLHHPANKVRDKVSEHGLKGSSPRYLY